MGESGQGTSHPAVIDRPQFQSFFKRFVESSITAVLWLAWLYWILPVITLLLWIFGIKFLAQALFTGNVIGEVIEILKNGGIAIILVLLLELVWVNYNYRMIFKKRGERRRFAEPATDEELAHYFHADPDVLKEAKKHRRIEMVLKSNETVIHILSDPDQTEISETVEEYKPATVHTNFPTEFMASALSSEMTHPIRLKFLLKECRRMDIEILPPDIKKSEYKLILCGAQSSDYIKKGIENPR